jgi:hypothetical protein
MSTIKTAVGDLVITQVQLADRVPPDCNSSSPVCNQATEGHQFLVVLLERAGGDPIDITDFAKLAPTSKEIYVIAGDDSRIDNAGIGLYGSLSYIAFLSPTSAQDFTLFWPDNPPIKLGK